MSRGVRLGRALTATAALLAATTLSAAPAMAAPAIRLAPLLPAEHGTPNGGYLVVLKAGVHSTAAVADAAAQAGGRDVYRYRKVLSGFSAKLSGAALRAVRSNPAVAYVRADSVVQAIEDVPAGGRRAGLTQADTPSWGIDRIDQRSLPLNSEYNYDTTGTGITAYVVDTGIRATHTDFGGRAAGVYNAVADSNGTADCHGHGTHVAGTIGGSTYGVAKNVQIRAVRVLNCAGRGTNADLIEGMDWIATHAPPRSIANFSLQNYGSEVDIAAERLIDAGVLPVFIGGNYNTDACGNSPRSARGIQVGASTVNDVRWRDSNYGSCIDIFAPGDDITSAGNASDTAVAPYWSGTSMAAPHVAGWLARYLDAHPSATLAQAKAALLDSATTGVLSDIGAGSPNRLLYANTTCAVGYALSSGGGTFTANLAITNTGTSAINGWTLGFTLPVGQTLNQPGWSATYTQSGQKITATSASWNSTLGPNQTVYIGFNGTGSDAAKPTVFTLNGASCTLA